MFTRLEDLPNELFLEIFSYVKFTDLAGGLWNLNQRVNCLIRALKYISLVITKGSQLTGDLPFLSDQIARLVIVLWDQVLCLNRFDHVRSLIFNLADDSHLRQVRAEHFPRLEYLSIPTAFSQEALDHIAGDIFSNRYAMLRHAELAMIDMPDSFVWSTSTSLHSLHLSLTNMNLIARLLHFCPRLTHLQVRLLEGQHRLDLPPMPAIVPNPLKQFHLFQPYDSLAVHRIEDLFLLMPHLQRLDLRIRTSSFIHLIKGLRKHLKDLRRFQCHIIEHPVPHVSVDMERIRNRHPCYGSIHRTLREDGCVLYSTLRERFNQV